MCDSVFRAAKDGYSTSSLFFRPISKQHRTLFTYIVQNAKTSEYSPFLNQPGFLGVFFPFCAMLFLRLLFGFFYVGHLDTKCSIVALTWLDVVTNNRKNKALSNCWNVFKKSVVWCQKTHQILNWFFSWMDAAGNICSYRCPSKRKMSVYLGPHLKSTTRAFNVQLPLFRPHQ